MTAGDVLRGSADKRWTSWSSLRAERWLGVGAGIVVALLVLPPLLAAMTASVGAEFAPLHRPDIVLNTLLLGVTTTVLAVAGGTGLALALVPGVPGRAMLERLIVMPLYLTPLLTAIGWSWLASPRSGLVNLLLRNVLGPGFAINVISASGVIVVSTLAVMPLPFLLVSDALAGIDASLVEAARVHGAGPRTIVRRIVLPLLAPAALASALLVFVQAVGLFSVPAVLGMPADFNVATTEIFRLLESYPPRVGEAASWGLLLLAITALLTFGQSLLLGRRSFATMSGKGFRPSTKPPRGRRSRATLAWLYVVLATVLPLLALLWAASVSFVAGDLRLTRFSTLHFDNVLFAYPKTWIAARNSTLLGVLTATIVCLLGLLVSWVILRTRQAGRGLIDQLSMVPLSVPAMVFALGLLWVYVRLPLPIYGTLSILLIAYVTHYLPFGVRAASAALRQLHPELEEAARIAGATWFGTMRRITLPLLRQTMIASWALLFIMAMQEVSSSILLYSSSSIVLSVAVFDLWENGNPSDVAALGFVQLAASFVVVGLALRARHQPSFS
ncbi:MAG: iron ABC transporter permease [Hyphomicrobiales bacterium]|nr:iron ABC transporter permease [Hyphomicrobiales bacterium]